MVTHNDSEFIGESGNRLKIVFNAIEEACERERLTVIPATIADIVELTFKTPVATVGLNKASGKVVFEEVGSFQELDVPLS